MSSWLTNLTAAINREYDRRIRRSSLITEYGAAHHSHADEHHGHADDGDDVAIANVPRGASVPTHLAADEGDAEIINAPRGSALPQTTRSAQAPSRTQHAPVEGNAPPAPTDQTAPTAPAPVPSQPEDDGGAEIVNARPGTPMS
ncbi:MAG: hypothetical protein RLZZ387_1677 [Chloroflexota bacterium]|jgi:hypothetical protein